MASSYTEDLYLRAATKAAESQTELNEALTELIKAQTTAQLLENRRNGAR